MLRDILVVLLPTLSHDTAGVALRVDMSLSLTIHCVAWEIADFATSVTGEFELVRDDIKIDSIFTYLFMDCILSCIAQWLNFSCILFLNPDPITGF